MERYRNLSGRSGVVAYEVHAMAIVVRFADGGEYVYTYDRPGERHVEAMKALARDGRGLATYINRFVRDRFAQRRE
jgi:hypothetical protein